MTSPGNGSFGRMAGGLAARAVSLIPLAALSGSPATLLAAQPAEAKAYWSLMPFVSRLRLTGRMDGRTRRSLLAAARALARRTERDRV